MPLNGGILLTGEIMARTETVKIVSDNDQGFIIINKSDMTKEQKEFKPKATRKPKVAVND